MAFLTAADRQRIAAAVARAEAGTAGELVTVVTPAADRYLFVPTLIAAAAALVLPPLLWWPGLVTDVAWLFGLQAAIFAVLLPLLAWSPLATRLVPRSVRHERAGRAARAEFYAQGLHRTAGGTGVLLFVAVAERYVEILADDGIAARVPPAAWAAIVADFTASVRQRRVADGFVAAVEACGALLARHVPPAGPPRNELPDRPVEL